MFQKGQLVVLKDESACSAGEKTKLRTFRSGVESLGCKPYEVESYHQDDIRLGIWHLWLKTKTTAAAGPFPPEIFILHDEKKNSAA